MSAAASPRQRQPHAAWSLGGLSALASREGVSSQVPSDDLFACNPSPNECGETTALRRPTVGGQERYMGDTAAPSQCLTAMGRRYRNRPKGLFAVARRGFGYPIMAALPEPVPDPGTQACCRGGPARHGRAEGHQQTRRDGVRCRRAAVLHGAEMLPTGLDAAARRDSCPRARLCAAARTEVGWKRKKEAFPLSGSRTLGLGLRCPLPRTGTINGKASGHAEQRRLDGRDWARSRSSSRRQRDGCDRGRLRRL